MKIRIMMINCEAYNTIEPTQNIQAFIYQIRTRNYYITNEQVALKTENIVSVWELKDD